MSAETAAETHARISDRVGAASWHELWAAVDNVLNEHQPAPEKAIAVNSLNCPDHSPEKIRERGDMWDRQTHRECPHCEVEEYDTCSSLSCFSCGGWPCVTYKAILGALGEAR